MSGKKYVPEDVYLVCDKGVKPSQLKTLSYTETWLYGEKMCTKVDKMLIVNFEPFGACSCANGAPCTAPVTDWTNVTDKITVGGNELLLEHSELPCTLGGNIKIFFSLADAMAALPQPEKSFWDKVLDVGKGYLDFQKGVAKGLWKGLKGTVTGVVDLAIWAGKHTPIYAIANPEGFAETIQNDIKTAKALGNLAKKAGTWAYRNSAFNALNNPEDFMAAQAENKVMFDTMMDKAANMSAEDWGELVGEIGFEVILEVATAGGAAALTALKVADKTVDVAKAVDRLDDLSDAAKAADKLEDISDGAKLPKVPEELGDVVYEKGGKKGEGWSKKLNGKLEPNSKYSVDGYLYETDELGRVKKVSGKLELKERGRNTYQQGKSVKVKDGIDGDQGGHLIGDRFNGPGEQINYVPQTQDLNLSKYKKMENDWQKALKDGKEVDVNIENIYDGTSKRPVGQTVEYKIDGETTKIDFEN